MATQPVFRIVDGEQDPGVTYDCGCPCTPTAVPGEVNPGFEHCCCGKVHFAGSGAESALTAYLVDRASRRKREPQYVRGAELVPSPLGSIEVAWAFPEETHA